MKPTDTRHAAGHHHDPAELHNVDVAHEHSDINIRKLVAAALGLAAITAAVAVLMWGVFRFLEGQAAERDQAAAPSPLAAPASQMPPRMSGQPVFSPTPGPRLLTNEYAVLEENRRSEEQRLNGYGWTDESAGVAHMPVSEAKKLILERGLPVRGGDPIDPTLGTQRPARGEASSGRWPSGDPRGTGLPDLSHLPAAPTGGAATTEQHKTGGH
jgi:hypothetical protein